MLTGGKSLSKSRLKLYFKSVFLIDGSGIFNTHRLGLLELAIRVNKNSFITYFLCTSALVYCPKIRNKKFDRMGIVLPPERIRSEMGDPILYEETQIVDIPAKKSDIILVGTLTESEAYLSNDKTWVYSEYKFIVESALKNTSNQILQALDVVIGTRGGGRVEYPSGKSVRYKISGEGVLETNKKYLVFLQQFDDEEYALITAYLLENGKVYPVDGSRTRPKQDFGNSVYDTHAGKDIQLFIDEVSAAIRNS